MPSFFPEKACSSTRAGSLFAFKLDPPRSWKGSLCDLSVCCARRSNRPVERAGGEEDVTALANRSTAKVPWAPANRPVPPVMVLHFRDAKSTRSSRQSTHSGIVV